MSLTRVYTTLAQTLIRKLGDAGGPPSARVDEELNRIIAWAKDSPRRIHVNTATVGNVGGGTDSLHSFSLPANTLATNGDYLRVWYGGRLAANANSKTVPILFGGQTVTSPAAIVLNNRHWAYEIMYTRLTSTTVRASLQSVWGSTSSPDGGAAGVGGRAFSINIDLTVSDLAANATTLLAQGAGTADNDITQNLSIIELVQQ